MPDYLSLISIESSDGLSWERRTARRLLRNLPNKPLTTARVMFTPDEEILTTDRISAYNRPSNVYN